MTDQQQVQGAGLTAYPVTFEMDYIAQRSRLTTFFRWILATPHFLFAAGYALAFYVVYVDRLGDAPGHRSLARRAVQVHGRISPLHRRA